MNELDVPFEQVRVTGHISKQIGSKMLETIRREIPVFDQKPPVGEARKFNFFTLRVCKECRADWMSAIECWFKAVPKKTESCGSGIFVRLHGINVEISLEEWEQLQKEKKSGN